MSSVAPVLFQTALSLLVAVVVAGLTVWLSLRRFRREKWWEAKMRAYADLLHALHQINRAVDLNLEAARRGGELGDQDKEEWREKQRSAWDEIRKQVDIGELLYSAKSMRILGQLMDETHSDPVNGSYVDHLLKLDAALRECLPAIKAAARADLGLPRVR